LQPLRQCVAHVLHEGAHARGLAQVGVGQHPHRHRQLRDHLRHRQQVGVRALHEGRQDADADAGVQHRRHRVEDVHAHAHLGLRQLLLHPAVVHALHAVALEGHPGRVAQQLRQRLHGLRQPRCAAPRVHAAVRQAQLAAHQVFGHVGRQAQRHVGFAARVAGRFGLAARQVDQRRVLDHLDLDARVAQRKVGQRLRQQVLHHHEGGGHAQHAAQFAVAAQHLAFDLLGLVGHAPRLVDHQRAGLGRQVAAARAVEQPRAQVRFQRFQPALHGGGVDAQFARRSARRPLASDGQCKAQVAPVEVGHRASLEAAILQTLNAKWMVVCMDAAAYSARMVVAASARREPAASVPRTLRLLERVQPLQRAPVRPLRWHTAWAAGSTACCWPEPPAQASPRNSRAPPGVCCLVRAPDTFCKQLLDTLPRLRRYARTLVFDAASADDLAQNTLERALAHWHQFDQRRDMVVWVLSIAHNAFLDGRRRDARLTIADPDELQRTQDRAGGDPGPDVGLRLDLLAALRRLSPDQREPLLLVCVEQLSYAEVAEVMHIPIGTVMSVCAGPAPRCGSTWTAAAGRPPPAVLRRVV
jgi:RNA polymerase sigma-70 factor (ECF subfamily)